MNIDHQHIEEFLECHAASSEPNVVELLAEIRATSARLTTYSPEVSSADLARTYGLRSALAFDQKRLAIAKQMKVLSERCQANGHNPSSIWYFAGKEGSFAVFELLPSRSIAACLKLEGHPNEFGQNDA
jgi:hypothetical protein